MTPATRNEAARHVKPPKVTPVAELAIGTAIATSRRRLQTVGQRRANTPSSHRPPQSETGTLANTHSGKIFCISVRTTKKDGEWAKWINQVHGQRDPQSLKKLSTPSQRFRVSQPSFPARAPRLWPWAQDWCHGRPFGRPTRKSTCGATHWTILDCGHGSSAGK